jgi:hypothetical protein
MSTGGCRAWYRLGPQADRIEVDKLAVKLRLVISPDRLDCRELLPHQLPSQLRPYTVVAQLLCHPSGTGSEQEPATGKMIDGRNLLRQDDQVILGNDAYPGAELEARGDRGRRTQHDERIQNARVPPLKLLIKEIPAAYWHMRVLDNEERRQACLLYHPRHVDDPGSKASADRLPRFVRCRLPGRGALSAHHPGVRASLWDTIASATQGRVVCAAGRRPRSDSPEGYEGSESRASPNGLPSESRQIAHRDPEWMTLPPSALTRPSAVFMSVIVK